MISLEEIDRAILDLENHDTTFATCEKLSWLYTVRDHISGTTAPKFTSDSESEFVKAACACDPAALLLILDEHFLAVRAIYPKEYAAIMAKITSVV